MFRHLEALTWSFLAEGRTVYPIYVYSEPQQTARGVVYQPRAAAERGPEGLACVDDVARAALLATRAYEQSGDKRHARLARRWLSFVYYMQLPDGRFANFVYDRSGGRNLDGVTSCVGGPWWTARALWALASAYRVLGDGRALAAIARCPMPRREYPRELKTRAVLALAGCELLQSSAPELVRAQWRRRVRRWCDELVRASADMPYVPDVVGERRVQMWGYHQLHALACAGASLNERSYVEAAERTVEGLIKPVLAANCLYAYPDERANQCAYCITPMVQGLAALYEATGNAHYRTLALRAAQWFSGTNDARAVMYDVITGRCLDGLTGRAVSQNCGAESAIEAGLAEIELRRLATASATRPAASNVS